MNSGNKKKGACQECGERRGRRRGKKTRMGKSIGCVRNDLNGLHFLTGHQKVILHPKARIDCACASHGLPEKPEGYLLGEFARYLFFCIRIRVGVGDDQCLFNVAAGMET